MYLFRKHVYFTFFAPPHCLLAGEHVAEVDRRQRRRNPEDSTAMVTPANGTRQNDRRKGENRQRSPTSQQEAGHTAAKEGKAISMVGSQDIIEAKGKLETQKCQKKG